MPLVKIEEVNLLQPVNFRRIQDIVQSLVLFPDDIERRTQYIASRLYEFARTVAHEMGTEATVTFTAPPNIWPADPNNMAKDAVVPVVRRPEKAEQPFDVSPQGVAGLILLQAFSFQDRGDRDIGLTKCIESLTQIFRVRQATLGSTKQNIKEIWHKHRPIAHIAAAMIIGYKRFGGGAWFNDPFRFVEFMRLSNTMMFRGEAIRHKQAAAPILIPGEGWEFVISPCAVLSRTGSKISEPGSIF